MCLLMTEVLMILVKKFANIKNQIKKAAQKFRSEVINKKYPTKKHSYS